MCVWKKRPKWSSGQAGYKKDEVFGLFVVSGRYSVLHISRIGESHTFAIHMKLVEVLRDKPLRVLFCFDSEFESLVKESNEKRIEKFYAGLDVIYKPTDRKLFSCVPLLCPARVYYTSSDDERD